MGAVMSIFGGGKKEKSKPAPAPEPEQARVKQEGPAPVNASQRRAAMSQRSQLTSRSTSSSATRGGVNIPGN